MKRVFFFFTVASILSGLHAQAAFINGSFENPGYGIFDEVNTQNGFKELTAITTAIDGWTVESGSVDYIGDFWQAAFGRMSIDLSGSCPGTLSQTFETETDVWYKMVFDLSGNPDDKIDTVKELKVEAGGTSAFYSYDTAKAQNSLEDMKWLEQILFFRAEDSLTKLTFVGLDDSVFGAAIDNVRVMAVPVPGSFLLLGTGLFGLIGMRDDLKRLFLNCRRQGD